jgi:ABC-2 type transport system ATP-binding protein
MPEATIALRGVTKTFGRTAAVRSLDLDVPRGSLCGFLGPNGAGKTTTIRMIMSIIYPDSGSVSVLGGSALRSKDRIGYLPEERGLYRKMRVGDFLCYMARLKGVRSADLRGRVRRWLTRVELPEVETRKCEELSKGMQQKIQFVAAVVHEPELIILDEPFSGLDPVNTELLRDLLGEQHAAGRTIIFSTHILPQAEQICDRIFLIHRGVKLLDATMPEIRERYDPRTILAEPLDGRVDLAAIDGVRDVRRLDQGPALELEVDDGADPQSVMRSVLDRHPMRSVELRRLSLTEVFVRLVGQGEGAAAAEKAREELSHV